ncbi:MAG: tetratricopeptide repeat protein [Spirulinaceae cyanobacterium SM2_1_0]|nr:tetratricopeptide repeat protein [Spirulinaceae cyanobacterium SM2_1_0]
MKLSLCTIVKDEAESLPACLDSVREVVDEMIVLDTGSTDDTIAVAEQAGAIVHTYTWNNDFAAARNEALKHVSGDWVLVLDADERLNPAIASQLRLAILNENILVVNLLRQEVGATQTPYSLVSRLFRKHPQLQFTRPYHALIDDAANAVLKSEPNWQIMALSNVAIVHFGYEPGAIAAKGKTERARAAMEQYLAANPNDAYACSKLGALYMQIGEVAKGAELLARGLQDPQAEAPVLFELNYHLANASARQGEIDQAVIHYQAALAQPVFPILKLGAYNNLGSLLLEAGEAEMALRPFMAAVSVDPSFVKGYYNLGMALKAQGNFKDAIKAYERAIQLRPDFAQAHQNLGVVWLKCGNVKDGLACFGRAIALLEHQNMLEAERLRQSISQMGFKAPKFTVEEVLAGIQTRPEPESPSLAATVTTSPTTDDPAQRQPPAPNPTPTAKGKSGGKGKRKRR